MEVSENETITVEATVNAPIEKVWACWTDPAHITQWYHASDDWHAPFAENDLQIGGSFKTTMAAKDGSFRFDFGGVYTEVREFDLIAYQIHDGRKVSITFESTNEGTKVTETFETENIHPHDMQLAGWQAILDNFKKHVESK